MSASRSASRSVSRSASKSVSLQSLDAFDEHDMMLPQADIDNKKAGHLSALHFYLSKIKHGPERRVSASGMKDYKESAKHHLRHVNLLDNAFDARNILAAGAGYARSEQVHRRRDRAARTIQRPVLHRLYTPYSDYAGRARASTGLRSDMGDLVASMASVNIRTNKRKRGAGAPQRRVRGRAQQRSTRANTPRVQFYDRKKVRGKRIRMAQCTKRSRSGRIVYFERIARKTRTRK